jgi:uncharacterized membrane-anchored protein
LQARLVGADAPTARRRVGGVAEGTEDTDKGKLHGGEDAVDSVTTPRVETYYWATILFSQTLGTALGDWMADSNGLGCGGGALVFGVALAGLAVAGYAKNISRVAPLWAAFILTRPLVATLGDLLDKPVASGGLALSRYSASAIFFVAIVVLLAALPQRAGQHPAADKAA